MYAKVLTIKSYMLYIYNGFAEEIDLYRWLVDHIDNFPTEITLVVPKLIEGKVEAKPFIDGVTRLQVLIAIYKFII